MAQTLIAEESIDHKRSKFISSSDFRMGWGVKGTGFAKAFLD